MSDPDVSAQMRDDWNARAREDAGYYVAFGRRDQDDAEFFATATQVVNGLEAELRRVPVEQRRHWKALEVGCGPGRLMRPMSRHFAQIHGVDVSDEMIARAKQNLQDTPNATVHLGDGSSLAGFADNSIEFIYSYAVFQHIPSREIVLDYLREIYRVLAPGGIARLQLNGLTASHDDRYTTWSGARLSSRDLLDFCEARDLQVLAIEGVATQYMWTTWRKQPEGWHESQLRRSFEAPPSIIRRITNETSSEPLAASRGRFASVVLHVENLPPDASLHHIRVTVGEASSQLVRIVPSNTPGMSNVLVRLTELEATGLLPVQLYWGETLLAPTTTLRVIPPGPLPPSLRSVSDGINLLTERRIETRRLKITVEDLETTENVEITVGGTQAENLECFCIDPRNRIFEFNCVLPPECSPGTYALQVKLGRHMVGPIPIQVVR